MAKTYGWHIKNTKESYTVSIVSDFVLPFTLLPPIVILAARDGWPEWQGQRVFGWSGHPSGKTDLQKRSQTISNRGYLIPWFKVEWFLACDLNQSEKQPRLDLGMEAGKSCDLTHLGMAHGTFRSKRSAAFDRSIFCMGDSIKPGVNIPPYNRYQFEP